LYAIIIDLAISLIGRSKSRVSNIFRIDHPLAQWLIIPTASGTAKTHDDTENIDCVSVKLTWFLEK
jgi:hypothetical protein